MYTHLLLYAKKYVFVVKKYVSETISKYALAFVCLFGCASELLPARGIMMVHSWNSRYIILAYINNKHMQAFKQL